MTEQVSDASGAGADALPHPATAGAAAGEGREISRRLAWGIFGLLFLVHLLDSLDRWLLPGVLRSVSEELVLTDIQAGWLATILLAELCPLEPGHRLSGRPVPEAPADGDRHCGLEPGDGGYRAGGSYDQLQLARVLVGIGGSTFGVIALTILMDLFPRGVRARVLSAYYLAMPLGAAPGPGRGLGDRPGHDLAHGVPARGCPWRCPGPPRPGPSRSGPGHERRGRTATAEAPRAGRAEPGRLHRPDGQLVLHLFGLRAGLLHVRHRRAWSSGCPPS